MNIRNAVIYGGLTVTLAIAAGAGSATRHNVAGHAEALPPQAIERAVSSAVQQTGRDVGHLFARVCVRHPRGVEAIPSVGPALTARQCHPPAA